MPRKATDPITSIEEAAAFIAAKPQTRWIAAHMARTCEGGMPDFSEDVETAYATSKRIVLGPWATALPLRQRAFVILHEALHQFLEHPLRNALYRRAEIGPDLAPYESGRMNRAEDYIVNDIIINDLGFSHADRPKGTLWDAQYRAATTSEDTVYCQLPSEPEDDPDNWDDHSQDPEVPDDAELSDDTPTDPQEIANIVDARVKQHMLDATAAGELPGGLARKLQGHYEPRVSWIDYFKDLLERCAGNTETTWTRPNRRRLVVPPHPYLPSSRGLSLGTVAICVDVSGSISEAEFTAFMGEIKQVLEEFHPRELHVVTWDRGTNYTLIEDLSDLENLVVTGGGGTDYRVALDRLRIEGIEPELVINMTDGWVDWPAEPEWQHITLSTSQPCPWGDNISVPLETLIGGQ